MKTAMQELIDELDLIKIVEKHNFFMVKYIIEQSLEKEKQQILKAYEDGADHGMDVIEDGLDYVVAIEYYNQTYNQNNNDKCGCFVSDGTTSMNCKFCGKHYSQHI